jgi:hypothetical protein
MMRGQGYKQADHRLPQKMVLGLEVLAKHIIMAATRGERNRRRLTEDALLHLPLNKLSKMPPARRLSASESEDISLTKEIIS